MEALLLGYVPWAGAIGRCYQGAARQRCRVHFMGDVLSTVPKGSQGMVAPIIRTAFDQPGAGPVDTQFGEVTRRLLTSHPSVAVMLGDAREDVLSFTACPAGLHGVEKTPPLSGT